MCTQESHSNNRIPLVPCRIPVGIRSNPTEILKTDEILSDSWLRSDIQIISVGFDRIQLSKSDYILSGDLTHLYYQKKMLIRTQIRK
jgi:hypothetical protein